MKRVLSLILVLILCASLLPVGSSAIEDSADVSEESVIKENESEELIAEDILAEEPLPEEAGVSVEEDPQEDVPDPEMPGEEPVEDPSEEPEPPALDAAPMTEEEALNAYRPVLDMFYENIQSDWSGVPRDEYDDSWMNDVTDPRSVCVINYASESYQKRDLDTIGYALVDLDRNGVPELITGMITGYDADSPFDVYTIADGSIKHIFCLDYIAVYLDIQKDGTLFFSDNCGMGEPEYYILSLENGGRDLTIKEFLDKATDWSGSQPGSCYYQYSDTPVPFVRNRPSNHIQDAVNITEAEYDSIYQRFSENRFALALTPFSEYSSEPDQEEMSVQEAMVIYKPVLDMFCDNISKNWPGVEASEDSFDNVTDPSSVCYMFYWGYSEVHSLSDAGYALIDIDENGIPELLVSPVSSAASGQIYDMYTIVDGKVVHLLSSYEKGMNSLCKDNSILRSRSIAYNLSYTQRYMILPRSRTFKVAEELRFGGEHDSTNPWFYYNAQDSDWVYLTDLYESDSNFDYSKMEHIAEKPASEIMDKLYSDTISYEVTPFSEYKNQPFGEKHIYYRLATEKKADVSTECFYSDAFFDESSWIYNHDLAKMSLCMATAAYNSAEMSYTMVKDRYNLLPDYLFDVNYDLTKTSAKNVVSLMQDCGFSDIMINKDYCLTTEFDEVLNDGNNIGVCIGSKELSGSATLIVVAIRGGGYGDEWIGNFNVFTEDSLDHHLGFGIAANKALDAINNYVQHSGISGDVKIWITGYSRAAATSNLVAAVLCRNGLTNTSLAPQNIYTYTFESPMGTKDGSADSSIYNGIWNIVNPIDLVPQVAMAQWGYRRYGHTVYLPCKYVNISEYTMYSDDVLDYFDGYLDADLGSIPQLENQHRIVKEMADLIATILGSEKTERMKLAQTVLQTHFVNNTSDSDETESSQLSDAISYAVSESVSLSVDTIDFFSFGIIPAVKIKGDIEETADEIKRAVEALKYAHYPDLTLAWLNAIPSEMVTEGGFIRYLLFNCPVDIEIYDSMDVLQARIINNEIIYEPGAYIEASVDSSGQKIVCIPEDVSVHFNITGTDSGVFNYSIQEFELGDFNTSKVINYFGIPISEGIELSGNVGSVNNNVFEYHLYNEDASEITPDEVLLDEAVEQYVITVNVVGEGDILSPALKTRGEFARVTAFPSSTSVFDGWYKSNTLLSKDTEYRFCVTEDTEITALFRTATELDAALILQTSVGSSESGRKRTPADAAAILRNISDPQPTPAPEETWSDWQVTVPATCTKDGTEIRTSSFGSTETRSIPAIGHDWGAWTVSKNETCTEEGERVRICSNDPEHIEKESVPAHAHSLTHFAANPATYTETGNTEYWLCSECGGYFSDSEGKTTISKKDTVIDILPSPTPDPTILKSGTCGENLSWTLTKDGRLTISGTGAMTEFKGIAMTPWYSCKSSISSIVVQEGVTSIGYGAFSGSNAESVELPDSLETISGSAFSYLRYLRSIRIPAGVSEIGPSAFCGSSAAGAESQLTSITVDPGNSAFVDVDGVVFSRDMKTLTAYPAGRAGSYTVPEGVEHIGAGAFSGAMGLSKVAIPDSVITIGAAAFSSSGLSQVNVPASVAELGKSAFSTCSSLTSAVIAGQLEQLDETTFSGCRALTTVYLPGSLECIKYGAFWDCVSISEVYYAGAKASWDSIQIDQANEHLSNAVFHFEAEP